MASFVNPAIQRQVQGLGSVRPAQKAVRTGAALGAAIARTRGSEIVTSIRAGERERRQRVDISDASRELRRAGRDATFANIIGAGDVAAGIFSARQNAILVQQEERNRQLESDKLDIVLDFIQNRPDVVEGIIKRFETFRRQTSFNDLSSNIPRSGIEKFSPTRTSLPGIGRDFTEGRDRIVNPIARGGRGNAIQL